MTHFQLLYCGDWWTNLLKHLFPLPPSTSLNPSLLQWEWRHGCRGSRYRQTTVIPWYTAKYLQQDSTRARTHTHKHTQRFTKAHAQASSRFSVSPFFTYARAHTQKQKHGRWWCSGCFGPWRRRHSNHSALTSSSGVQEERQTDTHCLCLFHFKLYYGNQFFFFFLNETHSASAHTHSADAVLAEGSFIGTFFACHRQRAGTFSDYLTGDINTHIQLTVLSVSRHVRSASAPV